MNGRSGIVATESRHTLEIGIMGLIGRMGELGRDGGGKYAAGVHGGGNVEGNGKNGVMGRMGYLADFQVF